MDSLEEMDKFLEMYNLPELNLEEIENTNRPITNTEIESVITKLQDQMTLQANSTKHTHKNLY